MIESINDLYETDFVLWLEKTAQLIDEGNFEQVDWKNLVEEIQELAKSSKRSLESQLTRIMKHMLKWDYQPDFRSRSWTSSIVNGRNEVKKLLRDSPSLKSYLLTGALGECYYDAVKECSAETGIDKKNFPVECPFSLEEILEDELS